MPCTSLIMRVAVSPRNSWGKRIIVCGHPVDRRDSPQCTGKVISSAVAHNADGANRQDRDESLPDLVVETVLTNLIDINRIGAAQNFEFLAGNFSRASGLQGRGQERDGDR